MPHPASSPSAEGPCRTPTVALLRRTREAAPGRRSADDRVLLSRYRQSGDPQLREALVERYLPLARSIARRHRHPTESFEDILQVACLALLKAIDRFDPTVGVEFSSYAVPSMIGAIKRHYRDHTWVIRVPRDLKELALRLEWLSAEMRQDLRRAPTATELAARLGLPVEDVLAGLMAGVAYRPDSLQEGPPGSDGAPPASRSIGVRDPGFAQAEDREALRGLMRHLTARERVVLSLRFDRGMSQQEIADCLGVSQMTVSRILRHVLARLRRLAIRQDGLSPEGRIST